MAKGSFALNIRKFAEKVDQRADQVVRHVVREAGKALDYRSPVGSPDTWKSKPPPGYTGGRFRGNWQFTAGRPATGVIDAIDPTGQVTMSRLEAFVTTIEAGDVVYLVNNLPYARRLEDGWSGQAPGGMVEITAIEFQDYVNQAIQALPR